MFGVLIPGGAATLLVTIARPWRDGELQNGMVLLAPLAIFAAYIAGHIGLVGVPEINPIDISHWLPHVSAAALLAAIATELAGDRAVLRWGTRVAVAIFVAYLLIRPLLASRWPDSAGWLVTGIAAATLVAYWSALEYAIASEHPRIDATILLIIASAFSAATGASGTVFVAQLGGATTAGIGALWLVTLKFPRADLIRAAIPMVAIGTWSLATLAHLYAAMRVSVLVELLSVPAAMAGVLFAFRRITPKTWLVRLATAVIISGVALTTAALQKDTPATTDIGAEDTDYGYQ